MIKNSLLLRRILFFKDKKNQKEIISIGGIQELFEIGPLRLVIGLKFIKQNELSDQKYKLPDLIVIATNSKGIDWCPEQLKKICLEN